jgi:hypothetical protein
LAIHQRKMEQSYWFSVRAGGTGMLNAGAAVAGDDFIGTTALGTSGSATNNNSGYVPTTMGIMPTIWRYGVQDTTSDKQNIFAIDPASYRRRDMVKDFDKIFQYTGKTRRGFCGHQFLNWFNIKSEDESFYKKSGINVLYTPADLTKDPFIDTVQAAGYTLQLQEVPLWRNTPYSKTCVLFSDEDIDLVTYNSKKINGTTRFVRDIIHENEPLYTKSEWRTTAGVRMNNIEKFHYMYLNTSEDI